MERFEWKESGTKIGMSMSYKDGGRGERVSEIKREDANASAPPKRQKDEKVER
jgi:hypothetical protein